MRRLLRGADLTVGNLESTLSTDGAPTQGGDSFGGTPALVPAARGRRLRRAVAGQQPRRRLRRARPRADRGNPAAEPDPAVRRGRRPGRGRRAGGALQRRTGRRSPSSASTRSARPRARTARRRARSRSGCHRAPARWSRPTWRGSSGRSGRPSAAPTSSWCFRTGGRSTPTCPSPCSGRSPARLVAAGADLVVGGHPHWVQGVDAVAGGAGAALARQLRLRHGPHPRSRGWLHEQTMEGVVLEATFWGPSSRRSGCCRTGWTPTRSRRAASRAPTSSPTCGRPAPARTPTSAASSRRPARCAPAGPGRRRAAGPVRCGTRRTTCCRAGRPASPPARTTSGRSTSGRCR